MLQKDVEDYEVAITLAQSGLTKDARGLVKKLRGHVICWLKNKLHLKPCV